jgi:hypothetical protein
MWWRILWGAEVASELVPEVVREEAPTEGAMIAVHRATVSGAATGKGMEVVLGHPTPYAPGDISVGEVMSTAHHALSQAQRILHREGEDLADERRRLQLWASMLKRMTVSERVVARARQHGFDLQVEAIIQRDADSRRALSDAQELYASAEDRANAVTKQEEDLDVLTHQVNQREQEVEELEGLLHEWDELDDITLRHELEVLSTRETYLDRREANVERE